MITQNTASVQTTQELSIKIQEQLHSILNKLAELQWICLSAQEGWDIKTDISYLAERARNRQKLEIFSYRSNELCKKVASLTSLTFSLEQQIGWDERISLDILQGLVPEYLERINTVGANVTALLEASPEATVEPPQAALEPVQAEIATEQSQPVAEPPIPYLNLFPPELREALEGLAALTDDGWEAVENKAKTNAKLAQAINHLERAFGKEIASIYIDDEVAAPAPAKDLSNLYIMKLRRRGVKGNEKQRNYLGTAYMASTYACTKSVAIYINSLLEPLRVNHDSLRFYLHMLNACTVHTYHDANYFVPICRDFIADKCPGAKEGKKNLIAAGLLECQEDYIPGEKSKRYRIPFEIQERIIELTLEDLLSDDVELHSDRYDLMKQRKAKDAPRSEYTLDGQKIAELQHNHIKFNSNTTNVFPKVLLCKALKEWRYKYKAMPEDTEEQRTAKLKEKERFISAFNSYKAATVDAGAVNLPNGMAMIRPAYSPQKSGRITMYRGGFQNLPRELQDVAFYFTEYRNFDMVSAQSKIAYQLLKEDGLESAWLKNYIDDPNAKKVHAAACFPDADSDARVKTFKDCLHAYLMGAAVTAPSDKLRTEWEEAWKAKFIDKKPVRPSAIRDILFSLYNTFSKAYEAFARWYSHCLPLINDISAWHKHINLAVAGKVAAPAWLIRNSVQKSQLDKNLGKPSCRNKMGCVDNIDGLKGGNLIREVVPFLLQGAEARFITEAEVIAKDYGIHISLNMHDGFIALVDDDSNLEYKLAEISAKASERSGVQGCLSEKPFKEPKSSVETEPVSFI
ncbi:hypothetical protein H6G80_28460 [Nostoc sp. FACHB-87]|uniref:hypothetical protein n=1 Tax=Nostocaceae TaxID=1162 RepID=UPI0016832425|nr:MULTISPECIES: hypothetical protein [Nostocaceae]MBD2457985.1 hypothetical protein [Nostoc sp. FACHB-87]MBD2479238.1 hypothetical protein [Anabaena sp. FACHB-83]